MSNKQTNAAQVRGAFANKVFNLFAENPTSDFNFRQIASQLQIIDKLEIGEIKNVLHNLRQQGSLIEDKRGKYKLNPQLVTAVTKKNLIEGIVDMKSTGKAYVMSTEFVEDIFISPNNTHHALNGDKVKVHLFPARKNHKPEGMIVEILERSKKQFVGIIHISDRYAFLVPDSPNIPVDIYIPINATKNAADGDKVVVIITDWPEKVSNPIGEVTNVLGKPGNNNVEMNAILAGFDFPLSFPAAVEKEANSVKTAIPQDEIKRRRDFRSVWTCTIDPVDAKDFDDALSLEKLSENTWEVGVHIADVSHYVRPGSAIDAEAYERGTSIYMVDRTIPMLPEKLSELVCSLRPNEEKCCFSAVYKMNNKGHVLDEWYGKTVIKSNRRYAYEEVQAMIEGGTGEFKDELMVLHNLSSKLREERMKKGAIAFKSQDVRFKLDENGKPIGVMIKEQKEANWLIEDFMLLANRKVAEKIGAVKNPKEAEKTFVYRIHDEPNPEKLLQFSELLRKMGYKFQTANRKTISKSFNTLFDQIAGKGEENMIEAVAIRTMARAIYTTGNIGHYGLGFDYYTHFTSPIRRYPDLLVHRLLEHYMQEKESVDKVEYEEFCKHSSAMERKAMEAERASIKYKQAEYLMDKIGNEFEGLISGVSKWGLFVELKDNKCEGLISLRQMNDDFYYLDEDNFQIIGQRWGKIYRLGDSVQVRVKKINLQKKQIDFELVNV